jgi:hypothetical protein
MIGHTDYVRGCNFYKSDQFVVSTSDDNTVRLWETNSGTLIKTLKGHSSSVWDCEIVRNDKLLTTVSRDQTMKIWNLTSGECTKTIKTDSMLHCVSLWEERTKIERPRKDIEKGNLQTDYEGGDNTYSPLTPLILQYDPSVSFKNSVLETQTMTDDVFESYKSYAEKRITDFNNDYDGTSYELSEEECYSIYFYTIEGPNQIYSILNTALTHQKRDLTLNNWTNYINYLLCALRKLPIYLDPNPLYRFIEGNLAKKFPKKYSQGNIITFYSFTSTSKEEKQAEDFKKGKEYTKMIILNPSLSGRFIQGLSSKPMEEEVLFPPCSTFKIVELKNTQFFCEITLEQVPTIKGEEGLKME